MGLSTSDRQSENMTLWCDLADSIIAHVTHDDVVVPIHCNLHGTIKLSNSPFSVAMALLACARQSGHMALWCDLVDTIVPRVSHNDVAVPIHCYSTGGVDLRNDPFSVTMTFLASARQSGHMTLWCDLMDAMLVTVSPDNISVPIHCD
jgi:hypothetical protein